MVDDSKLDGKTRSEYRTIIEDYTLKGQKLYMSLKKSIEQLERDKTITFHKSADTLYELAEFQGIQFAKDGMLDKVFYNLAFTIPLEGRLKIKHIKITPLGTFHQKILQPYSNEWIRVEEENGVDYRGTLDQIADNEPYIDDNSQQHPKSARGNPDDALETLGMIKNMLERKQFWEYCYGETN